MILIPVCGGYEKTALLSIATLSTGTSGGGSSEYIKTDDVQAYHLLGLQWK
jgi:hypothetical protein